MLSSVGTNEERAARSRRASELQSSARSSGWRCLRLQTRFSALRSSRPLSIRSISRSFTDLQSGLHADAAAVLRTAGKAVVPDHPGWPQHRHRNCSDGAPCSVTPAIAPRQERELAKRMAVDPSLRCMRAYRPCSALRRSWPPLSGSGEDDTDRYEDTLGTFLVHLATQPMSESRTAWNRQSCCI